MTGKSLDKARTHYVNARKPFDSSTASSSRLTRDTSCASSMRSGSTTPIFVPNVGLPIVCGRTLLTMNGERRLIGSFCARLDGGADPQAIRRPSRLARRQVILALQQQSLHHADGRFFDLSSFKLR